MKYLVTCLVMLHGVMGGHVYCCVHFHELAVESAATVGVVSKSEPMHCGCGCGHQQKEKPLSPCNEQSVPCENGHGCNGSQPVLNPSRTSADETGDDLLTLINWTVPMLESVEPLQRDFRLVVPRQHFAPSVRLHLLFGSLLI